MIIIPAIDLKEGQCVRLRQGLMDEATVFSDKPEEMAFHWLNQGAKRLHLVDLDGAFSGKPENLQAIQKIIQSIDKKIPIQVGGGVRSLETIENFLKLGINHVIIGTAALKNPSLLEEACKIFSGHIIVGIDAKDGWVATDGWSHISDIQVVELAKKFENMGVSSIIYTDIGRDGMMSGVNIESTLVLAKSISIPIIASGGLSNMEDIESLCKIQSFGIEGVITGRAIYEGSIDFKLAQEFALQF